MKNVIKQLWYMEAKTGKNKLFVLFVLICLCLTLSCESYADDRQVIINSFRNQVLDQLDGLVVKSETTTPSNFEMKTTILLNVISYDVKKTDSLIRPLIGTATIQGVRKECFKYADVSKNNCKTEVSTSSNRLLNFEYIDNKKWQPVSVEYKNKNKALSKEILQDELSKHDNALLKFLLSLYIN